MKIVETWKSLPAELKGSSVAIGAFDGVHRGHHAVIGKAREAAQALGAPLAVATFEPHPRRRFEPDGAPFRLTTPRQQAQALAAYQATVLTALSDVENALTALANGRGRVQALRIAARSAANAEQLAQQQYAAGLVDFETVLTSQRTLLLVQDSLKSSEADTATSLIQLYKALGGGWRNSNTLQGTKQRPE